LAVAEVVDPTQVVAAVVVKFYQALPVSQPLLIQSLWVRVVQSQPKEMWQAMVDHLQRLVPRLWVVVVVDQYLLDPMVPMEHQVVVVQAMVLWGVPVQQANLQVVQVPTILMVFLAVEVVVQVPLVVQPQG
jgi:hypothetical protein